MSRRGYPAGGRRAPPKSKCGPAEKGALGLHGVHAGLRRGEQGGNGLFSSLNQPQSPAPWENAADGTSFPSESLGERPSPRVFVFVLGLLASLIAI